MEGVECEFRVEGGGAEEMVSRVWWRELRRDVCRSVRSAWRDWSEDGGDMYVGRECGGWVRRVVGGGEAWARLEGVCGGVRSASE